MIREPEKERCHSHEIQTTSARDMILGLVLASLISDNSAGYSWVLVKSVDKYRG